LEKSNGLPNSWEEIEFKKTVKKIPLTGKKLKQKEFQEKGKLPVIDQGRDFVGGYTNKTELKLDCQLPVIVFGDHTKIIKFVNQSFVAGADGVNVLEPKSMFIPKLLYFFIQAIQLPNKGYARHYQYLEKSKIRIPPLNEQKRITEKIEELFSKIDSSFNELQKIKSQLKSYKTSLLKNGFLGELTKDFRKNNPNESVDSLLQEIENIKTKQEKKLQKISFPDEEYFHDIPTAWKWVRVGNICFRIQYGTSEKAKGNTSGIPVLRMGNIIDGELDFKNLKYFPKNWKEKNEYFLFPDNVLFNRTNSAELVGKTAVFKTQHPESVFASYLIRAQVASDIMLPFLLSYYVNSVFGRMFIKSKVSQQVGQANVNGTKFSMMCIPLIPMKEQLTLLDKIETGMSLIHNMTEGIETRLDDILLLKNSIIKQAFEGKLVPQDPNDEPASELLKRIKLVN